VNTRFAIEHCKRDATCKLVDRHPGKCVEDPRAGKTERADLKDSKPVPDLSGPRAPAIALGRKKRTREGPVRQQRG
jgi:hypothetical protein